MKYSYKLVSDYIAGNIGKREMLDYLDSLGLNPLVTSEEDGDLIFELETPANRGYLLSLSGVAREILPFTGSALKLPDDSLAENIEAEIPVKIENRKDCPYYSCRIMKDVSNGVSPEWMEKSLGKMGYRSFSIPLTHPIL